jgi:putative tricarboxylic transport membrane protein
MTRTVDLATAVVILTIGMVVVADSLRLGAGWGGDGPKSGFFPFWLGTILVLSAVALLAQAWRRGARVPFVSRQKLRPVLIVLLPAIGLVLVTEWLGLYVASALYLGGYMRAVGAHRWRSVFLVAIGIPVLTFLVFEKWFLVPMPKGPLELWLGY